MKTRKQLKKDCANAEQRALDHFRTLQTIDDILLKAEIDKTPSVIIVDEIKEVIRRQKQNNF